MNLNNFILALSEIIIPGSIEKDILCSSQVDFYDFLKSNNKLDLIKIYKDNIEKSFIEEYEKSIYEESDESIKRYLVKSKRKNFRLLNEISVLLCECYYSDYDALNKLNLPTEAPFPTGNIIQEIDLTILEDVYNRGKVYR